MTFSRPVTFAGWILITVAFAAATIVAMVSRGRFPDTITVLRAAMRNVVVHSSR